MIKIGTEPGDFIYTGNSHSGYQVIVRRDDKDIWLWYASFFSRGISICNIENLLQSKIDYWKTFEPETEAIHLLRESHLDFLIEFFTSLEPIALEKWLIVLRYVLDQGKLNGFGCSNYKIIYEKVLNIFKKPHNEEVKCDVLDQLKRSYRDFKYNGYKPDNKMFTLFRIAELEE